MNTCKPRKLCKPEMEKEVRGGEKKWNGAESNRRHKDFQSFALPTELPFLPFRDAKVIIFCGMSMHEP